GNSIPRAPRLKKTAQCRWTYPARIVRLLCTGNGGEPMLTPRALVAGLVIILVVAIPASAGSVWLNPDPASVVGNPFDGTVAARAYFCVNNTSWDMLLDHDGTNGNSSDIGTKDLGKLTDMNSNWYDFSLVYQPGTGFVFDMKNLSTGLDNAINWSGN